MKCVREDNLKNKKQEILETFRKVEVNIPLLDYIKQIPRYAKFLKELCTHKKRLKGNERISMGVLEKPWKVKKRESGWMQ